MATLTLWVPAEKAEALRPLKGKIVEVDLGGTAVAGRLVGVDPDGKGATVTLEVRGLG